MPRPILMTQKGLINLQKEKLELEKNRPAAVEDLRKAREMGDLSENGYYKAARAKLSSLDARLRNLTYTLRFAKVQEVTSTGIVDIGVTVVLETENGELIYAIVGEHEANPIEKKISHKSPVGRALIGKKVGETIVINTPSGQKTHKITAIRAN